MRTNLLNQRDKSLVSEPYLEINGGNQLNGEVEISGAKNAALPAIVAACLSDDVVTLRNVPLDLNDVKLIIKLLKSMGANISTDTENKTLFCSGVNWKGGSLDSDIAERIRHSLLLLGLAASWKTNLFLPMSGGCDLGNRRHDMHVSALRSLGNTVVEDEGILIEPVTSSDKEVFINFYYPTFGGTLNAIFASVRLNGCNITINNAACNPEVLDVIELLSQMGADITWMDERTLSIKGVGKLDGTNYSVMPDRIIGATVIAATALTKGNVYLKNFNSNLLTSEIKVWTEAGLLFEQDNNGLFIKYKENLTATNIETNAYPGFHTDIQPLHTLMMTIANGESLVKETILDGRFKYCNELVKMGADITVSEGDFYCVNGDKGKIAKIKGMDKLYPAEVKATDIRGGAAVAVAGLAAEGLTKVNNIYQLERGYGNFVEVFNSLGADIKRISK